MSLLRNRGYTGAVCSALVGNMVYFSMRYAYIPYRLDVNLMTNHYSLLWPTAITALYTTDTIKTGWLSVSDPPLSPHPQTTPSPLIASHTQISTGAGVIVGEVAAGILMKPVGYTKYQLIITTLMITAFSGALASINQYRQAYGIAVRLSPILPPVAMLLR